MFDQVLAQVVDLANKANASRMQRATFSSGYPMVSSSIGIPAVSPTAEETVLRQYLEGLPIEVVFLLTALAELGRGDYEADRLLDRFARMPLRYGAGPWAARMLTDKIPLPRQLEVGVRKAQAAGIDLEAAVSVPVS